MSIVSVIERIEAHIATLFESGAPHQKPHAEDLKALVEHVRALESEAEGVAVAHQARVENLEASVAALTEERDDARAGVETLEGEVAALRQRVTDARNTQSDPPTPPAASTEVHADVADDKNVRLETAPTATLTVVDTLDGQKTEVSTDEPKP